MASGRSFWVSFDVVVIVGSLQTMGAGDIPPDRERENIIKQNQPSISSHNFQSHENNRTYVWSRKKAI